MTFEVPADPLAAVFTPAVIERLASVSSQSKPLADRLAVLTTSGSVANERYADQVRYLRARKSAWDCYLTAAFACGLLEEAQGADVISRLTGVHDDNFRSAMAECLACWFLAGKLKLRVTPKPTGASGRVPDLLITLEDDEITVEVKAPYTPPVDSGFSGGFVGDDSSMLAACVDQANKQFSEGKRNLLLLVPQTKFGFPQRHELIRAFFGQTKIVVPIRRDQEDPTIGPYTKFFPEGKFLKIWKDAPRFTRIGAVLCLGEKYVDNSTAALPYNAVMDHHWIVLHNPYCPLPVPEALWGGCSQLVRASETTMQWSDGHGIDG